MKRFSKVIIVLMMLLLIAGCSANEGGAPAGSSSNEAAGEASADDAYPNKPINVIVSYSAGGNTDIAARILLPYVEEELGVPLNVINKPGGGGWTGWTEFLNADKDGYTIGYINTPNLITGYLNPEFGRTNTLDDFELIANHVLDYGAIAVRADDERFETIDDLIAYAQENDVTATSTGYAGDDHIAQLRINSAAGTRFIPVHQGGTSEMLAAVIGGHVDVYFDNVGSVKTAMKNGDLKPLAVMAPERSKFLPDVPTLEEAGLPQIVTSSARGLSFAKGVDEKKMQIVIEAFEKALNNPEQIQKIEELGYMVYPISGDEYRAFLEEDEQNIIDIKDVLNW